MKSVAVIGYGWVGKAMYELFPNALVYLRDFKKYRIDPSSASFTDNKDEINTRDIAFICVPTPCRNEGKLDTSIVEECISWCECPLIVVRSTVNPGDCDKWARRYSKRIIMQPEYLGETPNHPLLDTLNTPFLILGGAKLDTRELIDLYATVYNANTKIRQTSRLEAEIIKISENRAIAFKVSECQELYDVCEKAGINYYVIRDAVYSDDPRFNLWWSFIYPDKRGFNSKCIPKDIYAWCAWAESVGYAPDITKAILKKNKQWIGQEDEDYKAQFERISNVKPTSDN